MTPRHSSISFKHANKTIRSETLKKTTIKEISYKIEEKEEYRVNRVIKN